MGNLFNNEIFWRAFVLILTPFVIYRLFQRGKKNQKEQDLADSLMTPSKREELSVKVHASNKLFLYSATAVAVILPFLRNTSVGFFLGIIGIVLSFKVFINLLAIDWAKNNKLDKRMMAISLSLTILLVVSIAYFYSPQLAYYYRGRR